MDALFGTTKSQPVYPGSFAGSATAVTYFIGFYTWNNDRHPLTTLAMHTPNQVHTRPAAGLLAARTPTQAEALARRYSSSHAPTTLEEPIAQTLPEVSQCPIYSWAGPNAVQLNARHPLRN